MIDKNYERQVIEAIQKSVGATIPLIIKDLIQNNVSEKNRLETSWLEYKGEVPILFKPKLANKNAPDNRPVNAYRNLIVSEKVNYLTGTPIKYDYPEDDNIDDMLQNFLKVNNYETLDNNTMTYLASTGKAFRLLYLSKNHVTDKLEIKMANQLPWECIVVTDSTLDNLPVYGLIYYQVEVIDGSKTKKWRYKAEFYDEENVYYFVENDSGNYVPDTSVTETIEPHGFDIMPLIQFDNNLLKQSDFEMVRALINSYDNALSYALNDNESFSNALMLFKDVPLTQALIDQARYLRGIQIDSTPSKPNPDVSYLTKDIKIDNTETLCEMIEENIFKFSSTIDIFSEVFSGNVSGESRKQQLIPLEMKCKETERLFQYAMTQLFNVVATYMLKVNNIKMNPEEVDYIFIRSIVPNEQTIDQIIALFGAGLISHETALAKLSFIDSPEDEMKKIEGLIEPTPEPVPQIVVEPQEPIQE